MSGRPRGYNQYTDVPPRPIRVEGDLAYVTLTRGYVSVIDAADVPLVSGRNWSARPDKRSVYVSSTIWVDGRNKNVSIHRLLMGDPEGFVVDHIDGDGLNNRRSNLRIVTPAQNACNRRANRNGSSGLKGVGFHKATGKWTARIGAHGVHYNLGLFDDPAEAYRVYCEASEKLHGPFGRVA